jgi:hypothetical protein
MFHYVQGCREVKNIGGVENFFGIFQKFSGFFEQKKEILDYWEEGGSSKLFPNLTSKKNEIFNYWEGRGSPTRPPSPLATPLIMLTFM